MMPEELKRPRRISLEFDIRQPVVGVACGLVLLAGWLLLGRATDSTELLPLPEPAQATGAGRQKADAADFSGGRKPGSGTQAAAEEKAAWRPERKGKSGSVPQAVRDPFWVQQTQPETMRQGSNVPAPQTELRLSGIVAAGDSRLAMVSRGSYDFCLAEGETVEGLTLLELGADYAVCRSAAGTKILRLTNAAGGGRSRDTKLETRSDARRTSDRTRGERERRR